MFDDMKKYSSLLLVFLLLALHTAAQKPEIVSIDRLSGATGEIVNINGYDFGDDPSQLKVFFGGASAEIKSAGNQLIEAYIPSGATYDNISVSNITSGLTTYSRDRFFINFSGEHGLAANNFTAQTDFDAESGLYDLCLCDFNDDGKLDVASVGEKANTISFFQNTSTPGNTSFTRSSILANFKTLHVTCGDLNGDGRAEIVATQSEGDRVFILMNNGGFSFTLQTIRITDNKVKRIAINDLDLDGKPDLVVTNQLENLITVLPNQSSVNGISFGNPMEIVLPDVISSDALDIQDMNADGLPEIVTSPFQSSNNNKIFILVNRSSPGNFNFDDKLILDVNNAVSNVRIADLDGDGKPDFAATKILNSEIAVFRNTSTDSEVSFADPLPILTSQRPWGIDYGDLDGDNKLDIVVASIEVKGLVVLNNTSTPGTISFTPMLSVPTTYTNKHPRIGDIDGDGKPDITFTSIDFASQNVIASKTSVILNKACMIPKITPEGSKEICDGFVLELSATVSAGTTYEWKNAGTQIAAPGSNHFINVGTAGTYTVTATTDGCEKTSNSVTITISQPGAGLNGTEPEASNTGPVCSGADVTLQINNVGATSYRWTGPNDFNVTVSQLTTTIEDFQLNKAGLYIVEMLVGTCVSRIDSTVVEVIEIPEFSITYSGSEEICQGETKVLTASPLANSGFHYQWMNSQGAIPGATTTAVEISQSESYRLQVTPSSGGCPALETEPVGIVVVAPPVAAFTIPPIICLGTESQIVNQSTVDAQADAVFSWEFAPDVTSNEQHPQHTYPNIGESTVTLHITYTGVPECSSETFHTTEIVAVTVPEITATTDALCPEDTTVLTVLGEFQTITWEDQSDAVNRIVREPGTYSVTTLDNNNCESQTEIAITEKVPPVVSISVPKEVITLGESIVLTAEGADLFAWSPSGSLSDSTSATPTASPSETTTYAVIGTKNGCKDEANITIQVALVGIGINASPMFSPNDDGNNDLWTIQGVQNYPDCTLNIFDGKGRRVYEKMGYNNEWDARVNGTPLPEGVYYFVFGCQDKKATGSVTIVR